MRLAAAATVILILGGFAVGWLVAPVSGADMSVDVVSPQPPRLSHPGLAITRAVQMFAKLRLSSPSPPVLPTASDDRLSEPAPLPRPQHATAAPPRMAPRVDIAVRFQRELTAVVGSEGGPVLWMVDPATPTLPRRIRAGERYRDGWRVAAIEDQFVVLQRRRERRRVSIFDDGPGPEAGIGRARAMEGALPAAGPAAPSTAEGGMSPSASVSPPDARRAPRRQLLRSRPR